MGYTVPKHKYINGSEDAQEALVNDDPTRFGAIRLGEGADLALALIEIDCPRLLEEQLTQLRVIAEKDPNNSLLTDQGLFNLMHFAARTGRLECLKVLIKHLQQLESETFPFFLLTKGKLHSKESKYHQSTILQAAVMRERVEVVRYILEQGQLQEEANKVSTLHYCLAFHDNPEIFTLLLNAGANVHAVLPVKRNHNINHNHNYDYYARKAKKKCKFNNEIPQTVFEFAAVNGRLNFLKHVKEKSLQNAFDQLTSSNTERLYLFAQMNGHEKTANYLNKYYHSEAPKHAKDKKFKFRLMKYTSMAFLINAILMANMALYAPLYVMGIYLTVMSIPVLIGSIFMLDMRLNGMDLDALGVAGIVITSLTMAAGIATLIPAAVIAAPSFLGFTIPWAILSSTLAILGGAVTAIGMHAYHLEKKHPYDKYKHANTECWHDYVTATGLRDALPARYSRLPSGDLFPRKVLIVAREVEKLRTPPDYSVTINLFGKRETRVPQEQEQAYSTVPNENTLPTYTAQARQSHTSETSEEDTQKLLSHPLSSSSSSSSHLRRMD